MALTLSHLLLQAADAHPERPAVWSSTGELTYADLYDRSMRLARAWWSTGSSRATEW